MTRNNLDIGLFEVMPNNIEANSIEELQDAVDRLGNGWTISDWSIKLYIDNMGHDLGVYDYIKDSYQYSFANGMECIIDNSSGSVSVMTDVPGDIRDFMQGEYIIMLDEDGEEYDVSKSDSNISDTRISTETSYVCRTK